MTLTQSLDLHSSPIKSGVSSQLEAKVKAEWHPAKDILISTPGDELFHGMLHYQSAFFQSPFDTSAATAEHQQFKTILRDEYGVQVHTVNDLLLSNPTKLRTLAGEAMSYEIVGKAITPSLAEQLRLEHSENLDHLSPEQLLRVILIRPAVVLRRNGSQNPELEHYKINPATNHFFQRDPQITTDKGVVLGRMKNRVRDYETLLAEHVFENLGITPLYRVNHHGTLEGGDYIPAGDYALIGQGLRTNEDAIQQLLDQKVFDFPEIAVVYDPFCQQDEMHLDTYFNLVAPDKGIIVDERIHSENGNPHPDKLSRVTLYQRQEDGKYSQKTEKNELTFQEYLEHKGVHLIPLPKELQKRYGINILTMKENEVIAVENVSPDYCTYLKSHGVRVREVPMENLTKGYGGPHCMTQVLFREEP